MLIYVFTENYPSQYKPYFDTQFEQFLKDGHSLRIFSLSAQGVDFSEKVKKLKLEQLTRHVPSTMHTVPRYWLLILTSLLRNPFLRSSAAVHIYDEDLSIKQYFMQVMRMMLLPLEKPDLCLVHNLTTAVQFSFLRKMYRKCPTAFYYHGGEVAGFPEIGQKDSRRGFAASDYVFTNTASSMSHAISRGCNAGKIKVCPVGFNLSEFDADGIKKYRCNNTLRIITIGRMSEEKGHIFALKAIEALIAVGITNIHYKLIGDGPLFGELKSYVQKNGIEDYVEFLGHVARDMLYLELKNSDVHLLPSIVLGTWQENQACVVQEAMLFKTLVINTTAGGVPESTAPIMRQFCVAPGDHQMIADKIKIILAVPQIELCGMGEQCREFALENYNIVTLNQRMLSVCLQKSGYGNISE
jgi:colanic acid/amylovoran/stewartan biosynthesis glycosyltransferase WcaL/AmsK/CpsK